MFLCILCVLFFYLTTIYPVCFVINRSILLYLVQINKFLPRNATIVNEGATTMDIGRTVLMNYYSRRRYKWLNMYNFVDQNFSILKLITVPPNLAESDTCTTYSIEVSFLSGPGEVISLHLNFAGLLASDIATPIQALHAQHNT